jgi:WD40 repeat protein
MPEVVRGCQWFDPTTALVVTGIGNVRTIKLDPVTYRMHVTSNCGLHQDVITDLSINIAKTSFVSGGYDRYIRLTDLQCTQLLQNVIMPDSVTSVNWLTGSNDVFSTTLASGLWNVWDIRKTIARPIAEYRVSGATADHVWTTDTCMTVGLESGELVSLDLRNGLNKIKSRDIKIPIAMLVSHDAVCVASGNQGCVITYDDDRDLLSVLTGMDVLASITNNNNILASDTAGIVHRLPIK